MIRLVEATKIYRVGAERKRILDRVSIDLPRRNIAILGQNGAGKSTLLRLLAGSEELDSGAIQRTGSVSWPLGLGAGFNATTTGADNTRFISRIYGQDTDEVLAFVREFSELGAFFEMPISTYSQGMRARLAFGISMAVSFDWYLVDEITEVGDERFKAKCRTAFKDKLEKSSILMVSHGLATLRSYCDMALLVHDGDVEIYDDLEEGIAMHREIMRLKDGGQAVDGVPEGDTADIEAATSDAA